MRRRVLAMAVLVVLVHGGTSVGAATRVLEGVDVQPGSGGHEIRVSFGLRLQYLTHAPASSGRSVQIRLRPLDPGEVEGFDLVGRQRLGWRPSAEVPLTEVVSEGLEAGLAGITLWFEREVDFDVRPGGDLRSFVVILHPRHAPEPSSAAPSEPAGEASGRPADEPDGGTGVPDPNLGQARQPAAESRAEAAPEAAEEEVEDDVPRYAVNLESTLAPVDHSAVPQLEGFEHYRIYTTEFEKDGKTWHRLRLGFFSSERDARQALTSLAALYPRAWVTSVSPNEQKLSAQTVVRDAVPAPEAAAQLSPDATGEARQPESVEEDQPALSPERAAETVAEAETAMTAGDYRRAIQLYTKLLRRSGHDYGQQAQELLGLARERNGQFAHAKAEYEAYLAIYPEGEGAERVRQRLAGLISAADQPKEKLRKAKGVDEEGGWEVDVSGGFSQFYRRDQTFNDVAGDTLNQSELSSDLDFNTNLRNDDYEVGVQFIGGHVLEFRDEGDDETRVNTLFLDVIERPHDVSLRLGRQSRSSGGVLGRFDGGLISYGITPHLIVNAVGGFPVDSTTTISVDSGKYFFGASLDLLTIWDYWDFNVFAINQEVDGITDRRAVGGEFRYLDGGRSLFGLVDFDVSYLKLNIAQLVGNWVLPDQTTLNFVANYRKSPILTTSNALQGQGVDSISDLLESLDEDEIRDLAEDRTADSASLTFGISRPINTQFQVSADATWSRLFDTDASGGVDATLGTGNEFFYTAQLIGNSLIKEGDIGILGLRYSDAQNRDAVELSLNTRYPINRDWRINPRFTAEYRWNENDDGDRFTLGPSIRVDYRWRKRMRLEMEAGAEWIFESFEAQAGEESVGYFVVVGYRVDF